MRRAATRLATASLGSSTKSTPSVFATQHCAKLNNTSNRIVTNPSRLARSYSAHSAMASNDETAAAATATTAGDAPETLPPLSAADFRVYNRLADKMELFHNHFRSTWNLLYSACTNNKRPSNMSLRQFLSTGLQFADQLTAHHTIEERFVFPMLAPRMPEFDPKRGDLIKQHEEIHEGLEDFEGYLRRCRAGEEDFEMGELRRRMEGWGGVLWKHLDDEVKSLGAARMRGVWTKEEMMAFVM